MKKGTISMKKFRSNLTKISRLAKTGYNSITSVAKNIISTVTAIASKISVVTEKGYWQGGNESLHEDGYQSYYDNAAKAEEEFLSRSLNNLANYKDEIIFDIYTISDALSHNSEQMGYMLAQAVKNAFSESTDDFFISGQNSGKSFGDGFRLSVENSMNDVSRIVIEAMQNINSLISSALSRVNSVSNVTYSSPSYNFYSSSQTVSEQLSEARRSQTVNELRGG